MCIVHNRAPSRSCEKWQVFPARQLPARWKRQSGVVAAEACADPPAEPAAVSVVAVLDAAGEDAAPPPADRPAAPGVGPGAQMGDRSKASARPACADGDAVADDTRPAGTATYSAGFIEASGGALKGSATAVIGGNRSGTPATLPGLTFTRSVDAADAALRCNADPGDPVAPTENTGVGPTLESSPPGAATVTAVTGAVATAAAAAAPPVAGSLGDDPTVDAAVGANGAPAPTAAGDVGVAPNVNVRGDDAGAVPAGVKGALPLGAAVDPAASTVVGVTGPAVALTEDGDVAAPVAVEACRGAPKENTCVGGVAADDGRGVAPKANVCAGGVAADDGRGVAPKANVCAGGVAADDGRGVAPKVNA